MGVDRFTFLCGKTSVSNACSCVVEKIAMKYGTTLLLFVLVLGIGAYIWFVERKGDTSAEREARARYALKVDAGTVTRFSVATDDLQLSVEKQGRQWMLTSPVRTRADEGVVARLLEELERMPRGEVITEEEQRAAGLALADYGLERPRVRIALGQPDGEQVILVGGDAKLGGSLYIKEASRPEILSTFTNVLAAVPRSVNDIRDRRLFEGFPADVLRVAIRRSDGFLELVREEHGSWRITKPVAARAADAAVQELLDGLFGVRVADFVAESVAAAPLYGLDEPAAEVTLSSRTGEQTLRIGRSVEHAPGQTYATIDGADEVFAVPTNLAAALRVRTDALRDRRLITIPAYEIRYIEMQQGERTLKLVQTGGVWQVTEPTAFRANDERVQIVLSEWTGARIEAYNDEPLTNLAEAGLAPPSRTLILARSVPVPATNGETTVDGVTVRVSAIEAGHDRSMVLVDGEASLYLISSGPVRAISVKPLAFRDLEMMAVEPPAVRSISVTAGGVEQVVSREGTNAFQAAVAAEVDRRAVDALLRAVRALRAVDLIAEDAPDPAAFGLDAPAAVLTLGLSAEAGLGKTLLIGKDAGEGHVYALIKGQDVVFTLEKALAETLTGTLYKEQSLPEAKPVESGIQSTASP
jgi:hypothetical protein